MLVILCDGRVVLMRCRIVLVIATWSAAILLFGEFRWNRYDEEGILTLCQF